MTEFRVLLEGGDVLVVDIHVEAAEAPATIDPTGIGSALLAALGLGGGGTTPSAPQRKTRPAPPPEPSAEEWLEQTSRAALKRM